MKKYISYYAFSFKSLGGKTMENKNLNTIIFKIKKLYEKQEMRKEKNAEKVHNIH